MRLLVVPALALALACQTRPGAKTAPPEVHARTELAAELSTQLGVSVTARGDAADVLVLQSQDCQTLLLTRLESMPVFDEIRARGFRRVECAWGEKRAAIEVR